jgi:hypothetical protein
MSEASGGPEPDLHREDTLQTVTEALERIEYGSIVITIHQGEVVSIETSTRLRPQPRNKGASA